MGIDGMGHASAASGGTMKTIGAIGAGFANVALSAGSVAAHTMGGPVAGAAVDSLRSAIPSGGGGGGQGGFESGSAIDAVANQAEGATASNTQKAGDQMMSAQSQQQEMFRLQLSANSMNESFNTLSNIAKNKHDTTMAAINNTR